jgi:hypothetical protein
VVSWVIASCIVVVGNHRFGVRATSIFRVKRSGQRAVATSLLPLHRVSWCVRHLHDHLLQLWRRRDHGLRNVCFQPPHFTAQQSRNCNFSLHRREDLISRNSSIGRQSFGRSILFSHHLNSWCKIPQEQFNTLQAKRGNQVLYTVRSSDCFSQKVLIKSS